MRDEINFKNSLDLFRVILPIFLTKFYLTNLDQYRFKTKNKKENVVTEKNGLKTHKTKLRSQNLKKNKHTFLYIFSIIVKHVLFVL